MYIMGDEFKECFRFNHKACPISYGYTFSKVRISYLLISPMHFLWNGNIQLGNSKLILLPINVENLVGGNICMEMEKYF